MPLPNSKNSRKGKYFEERVRYALQRRYKKNFSSKPISIGNPPKLHKFDLVSDDEKIVTECKNYSYTEMGNIPSAKIASINEAVLYLSHAPKIAPKVIVLRKEHYPKRKESLADYYKRTYAHLLEDIIVMELDLDKMILIEK